MLRSFHDHDEPGHPCALCECAVPTRQWEAPGSPERVRLCMGCAVLVEGAAGHSSLGLIVAAVRSSIAGVYASEGKRRAAEAMRGRSTGAREGRA